MIATNEIATEEITSLLVEGILSPSEKEELANNWDHLLDEFRKNGTLSLSSVSLIIGNPPIIPTSPDMDTMLESYDERAAYGKKCEILDSIFSKFA